MGSLLHLPTSEGYPFPRPGHPWSQTTLGVGLPARAEGDTSMSSSSAASGLLSGFSSASASPESEIPTHPDDPSSLSFSESDTLSGISVDGESVLADSALQNSATEESLQSEESDTDTALLLPSVSSVPVSEEIALLEKEQTQQQKASLRAYMRDHSIQGDKPMRTRVPFVGEVLPFTSPVDEEVSFGIKRLNNADVMKYRDKNSVVRFINEGEGNERFVQEKDYPMGTMRVDTVELGLASWNITDEKGTVIPIDRKSILSYLAPEELDAVYEQVLEVNPILTGREKQKND